MVRESKKLQHLQGRFKQYSHMSITDIHMPPCTTLEATFNYYSDAKLYTLSVTRRWEGA